MNLITAATKTIRDQILEAAKRDRQARDYAAVLTGQRTSQSMHLFGQEIAQKVIVQYRDVDFD